MNCPYKAHTLIQKIRDKLSDIYSCIAEKIYIVAILRNLGGK
jgi:hypothetical protein